MRLSQSISELSAGRLRDLVTIQEPTYTPDDQNGSVVAWGDVDTVYARVVPLRNSRTLESLAIDFTDPKEVYVRYMTGITKDMRVVFAGKEYTIHSVEDINSMNQYLKIVCYGQGIQLTN